MTIRKIDTPDDMPEIWFVGFDVNGNSRYVVSYLAIPTPYDDRQTKGIDEFRALQSEQIEHARQSLPAGKRYRAKWFGGGIVFQAYAGDPVTTVRAAMAGVNVAEYFARQQAMLNHPAGKGL